jgi:hypothetical protein
MLVGALMALIGVLQLFIVRLLPGAAAPDRRAMIVGLFVYAAIGGLLIWVGLGSIRKRRWVRSMMLTIGWSWLFFGVLALAMIVGTIDEILADAGRIGEPLPQELRRQVKIFMFAVVSGGAIILPLFFLWAYRPLDVLTTCAAAHPLPDWSDRCPPPVLGLSFAWLAMAVISAPTSVYAAMPFFGMVLTGWPAIVLTLLLAAACGYVAREVFLMRPVGWWGSMLLLLLIGLSTLLTFLRVELGSYLLLMGYPESQARMMSLPGGWVVAATAVLTLISLVYMAAIRRHFLNSARVL